MIRPDGTQVAPNRFNGGVEPLAKGEQVILVMCAYA
jgi:hypothetical protein